MVQILSILTDLIVRINRTVPIYITNSVLLLFLFLPFFLISMNKKFSFIFPHSNELSESTQAGCTRVQPIYEFISFHYRLETVSRT